MIVRVFKAKVRAGKETEWEKIIQDVALPMMRKQTGLVDAFYTWDTWNSEKEFAFVSVWRSVDDVKRFAGANWREPVIPPEEKPYILSSRCDHFEPIRAQAAL